MKKEKLTAKDSDAFIDGHRYSCEFFGNIK